MFQKYHLSRRDLKNFFRCSFYRITNKLQYPKRIIPRNFYKAKIDIQGLLNSQALFVTRRLDISFDKAFNKHGNELFMREDDLDKDDIPNMSMNLMGGKFKDKDVLYSPFGEGSKNWIPGTKIYLDNFLDKYKVLANYTLIYFMVSEIHNITVPYSRPKDRDSEKLAKALANATYPPKSLADSFEFNGRALVLHAPTNLNYWHTEYVIMGNDDRVPKNRSSWREELCKSLINNLLVVNGVNKLDIPITPIAPQWYKN